MFGSSLYEILVETAVHSGANPYKVLANNDRETLEINIRTCLFKLYVMLAFKNISRKVFLFLKEKYAQYCCQNRCAAILLDT